MSHGFSELEERVAPETPRAFEVGSMTRSLRLLI